MKTLLLVIALVLAVLGVTPAMAGEYTENCGWGVITCPSALERANLHSTLGGVAAQVNDAYLGHSTATVGATMIGVQNNTSQSVYGNNNSLDLHDVDQTGTNSGDLNGSFNYSHFGFSN